MSHGYVVFWLSIILEKRRARREEGGRVVVVVGQEKVREREDSNAIKSLQVL